LKYAQNYQDAEDILQDSFLLIFAKIDQYKEKGSFEGWMKRITINVALQKYRQRQKLQVVRNDEVESEEVSVDIEEEIETDFLLELIQQLPDQYRLVFNLYVLDHFSHKQIAEMLQISEGTSKSNLSRARAILKQKITIYQQKKQEA
jgi:RNA polymerase sigma-70 factor (ECF subfamily)